MVVITSRIVVVTLQGFIAVFAVCCCMAGGVMQSPPPLVPITNTSDNPSETGIKSRLMRDYADRNKEPWTHVIVPCLITTATTALLLAGYWFWRDLTQSTTFLNANVVLFVLHFSYFLIFTCNSRPCVDCKSWDNSVNSVVAIHATMLGLLGAAVVVSGVHLRRSRVSWPCCNFLQTFTVGMFFTLARLITSAVVIPVYSHILAYGLESPEKNEHSDKPCYNRLCSPSRTPSVTYFGFTTLAGLTLVISIENLLSHVWGQKHKMMALVWALVSGVATLIAGTLTSPIALPSTTFRDLFSSVLMVSGICFVHAWLIAMAHGFISAPPNILKLLCGVTHGSIHQDYTVAARAGDDRSGSTLGLIEESPDEPDHNGGTEEGADESDHAGVTGSILESSDHTGGTEGSHDALGDSVSPDATSCTEVQQTAAPGGAGGEGGGARRIPSLSMALQFLGNLIVLVVGVVCVHIIAQADATNMTWSQLMMVAAVVATMHRAVVAVIPAPTTHSTAEGGELQIAVTTVLEVGLMLVPSIATIAYNTDFQNTLSAALVLVIAFVRVFMWLGTGLLQRVIERYRRDTSFSMPLIRSRPSVGDGAEQCIITADTEELPNSP